MQLCLIELEFQIYDGSFVFCCMRLSFYLDVYDKWGVTVCSWFTASKETFFRWIFVLWLLAVEITRIWLTFWLNLSVYIWKKYGIIGGSLWWLQLTQLCSVDSWKLPQISKSWLLNCERVWSMRKQCKLKKVIAKVVEGRFSEKLLSSNLYIFVKTLLRLVLLTLW